MEISVEVDVISLSELQGKLHIPAAKSTCTQAAHVANASLLYSEKGNFN